MKWLRVVLVALAAAACLAPGANGLKSSGSIRKAASWAFLEKYIFAKGKGTLELEALFPADMQLTLALYFMDSEGEINEMDNWQKIANGPLTCTEKLEAADYTARLIQSTSNLVEYETIEVDGQPFARVLFSAEFATQRSRFLFATLGSCAFGAESCTSRGCDSDLQVDWELHLRNGDDLLAELDAGAPAIAGLSLAIVTIYWLWILLYLLPVLQKLYRLRKLHVTVLVLLTAMCMQACSFFLSSIAALITARTGERNWRLILFADFTRVVAETLTLLLCNLLAKGWTIVARKISAKGRVRLTVFVSLFLSVSSLSVLYFDMYVPKYDLAYMYDSYAGLMLLLMHLLAFLWVQRAVQITLNRYKSKKRFYSKFRRLAGLWLLASPFTVAVLRGAAPYTRSTALFVVNTFVLMLFHFGLSMLYDPDGLFADSFPFHATTTHMSAPNLKQHDQASRAAALNRDIGRAINFSSLLASDMLRFLSEIDPVENYLERNDVDLPAPPRRNTWVSPTV